MKYLIGILLFLFFLSCSNRDTWQVVGLQEEVEIIRDDWGLNHIYAQNQHDLFFAQGYAAAKDRLFQFEIWRRQATGTVAEILGPRELKRDIGTRLFQFRGDINEEMSYYHNDGIEIITAYTDGVNAYINEILQTPESLPIEFKALNILPQKWTPEVVISRHQGLLGNIGQELAVGRTVAKIGATKTQDLNWFHPKKPDLTLDASISSEMLEKNILDLYYAYRRGIKFLPEDVIPEYRATNEALALTASDEISDSLSLGSNNWVVSGAKTGDGNTYMANDPHRTIAVPSLRYMAHLVAPGWNVIGGGEPEIPGISIGHNEYGAWGLTVFRTDGEDLMVYDINPKNPNQYKYKGKWTEFKIIQEMIKVKDQENEEVELRYSVHGPVVYVDNELNKAYAVRCAWLEVGGSPYLASLRMDQAKTWEEFREACNYSHIPGENMIWADKKGNIGWQAVGIAPIRSNFSGMVPVPGDGRYEWEGYLPIVEKPNDLNPASGFIGTANQNVTPESYDRWDAIGFSWSDPYRGDRVNQVLEDNDQLNMDQMKALQVDYFSIPASELVPLLDVSQMTENDVLAYEYLADWDFQLLPNSIAAAIYVEWETQIQKAARSKFIPQEVQSSLPGLQLKRTIDFLNEPEQRFGSVESRNRFLSTAFAAAVDELNARLGDEMGLWQYGQIDNKHTMMTHALSDAVNDELKSRLDVGPLPRGGNGYTPGSTGNNLSQSSGASFRMIVNTGDWDAALATNGPGQSGNPESPFYDNLFEPWAKDQYFNVYFSKEKILSHSFKKTILKPALEN